ncbi:TerD family protein [Streptomyces pristinaespiralis]|uniref:DNA polymerase III n=1 Tax=Streptomyces pristinaespiralis TaxID=38300 RepID=A0A0M3QJF4_STRPR|nr:TerD family protein [Streptomyces pristinaespiralis]ALC23139.1 DNA polymerase III [Streptomyces pristinaespiralis]QMU14351.1 TerD family protein [Streptomyces pristinaespiralis]
MTLAAADLDVSNLPAYAHDWALVDVETSGLVARRDRVLSVAVVTVGPDGAQTGEFSTLLDPGCDPGPVHVHGLTAERLHGAPAFEEVAQRISQMLEGRVLVAHNAQFDYDFLAHEFARAGVSLPVARRLCTLALNRRVDPPTQDLRLGTLAAHYGVPQLRAHDALDDTRVLAGVLRASLREAARLDLRLPFVACPPRQDARFTPSPPKTPCAYRNPGRMAMGGPLVQGMKIAVTGPTAMSRPELVARAVAAGLNVMGSVSRHTGVLVTNDRSSGSAKARRAVAEGVPVIDEQEFLRLLEDVRPGTAHETSTDAAPETAVLVTAAPPASVPVAATPVTETASAAPGPAARRSTPAAPVPAVPAAPVPAVPAARKPAATAPAPTEPVPAAREAAPARPLRGRRVLVLGGSHPEAASARARVVELGGAAAINLSSGVTDVVLLAGAEADRRMRRIATLLIPAYEEAWLDAPVVAPVPDWSERRQGPQVLPRGGVVDLPDRRAGSLWSVSATWAQQTTCEIDLVAFLVDEDDQVTCDEHFVFYGAPESPDGAVRLLTDGPTEQTVTADLGALPPAVRRVVVAAAIDGTPTFGDVGAVQVTTGPGGSAAPLAQAALDAATTERTLLLAELYRRGPLWRFRAVGQGYDHGLAALARGYGVDVAD